MPGPFCLLPKYADAFMEKVTNGEFDAARLSAMSSAERRAAFAEVMGDANAAHVNANFESKLLLKNQQAGLTRWIEQTTKKGSPIQRDLLSRIDKMTTVLEPASQQAFLADLAQRKLGFKVTMDEAGQIAQLGKEIADAKASKDINAYLDARAAFREYTSSIQPKVLTGPQKAAAYVRAGALSWPTTLVKLTSTAFERFVITPVVDLAAMGVAKALPRLAEGAPRYGTTSPRVFLKAEAAAWAASVTDGIIDAGRMLRNKPSRLDLMFGSDKNLGHAWYEYNGSIHGALKEPVRRAEYARSLYRRTAEAAKRGEDISDMGVQMRLRTEAFDDATGAISMQDNAITSGWNGLLGGLERVDAATGKPRPLGVFLSTVLRADTPVMKAPSNIVLEASDYIGGLLTGSSKVLGAMWKHGRGLEGLKPIQRDAIIRQIARGKVGAALMALYFFKHKDIGVEFGGFYKPGEKRYEGDVEESGARVGETDIPKQVLHHPLFGALQFSASMARTLEDQHRKDDTGVGMAAAAAAFGLIDELPVISTATDIAKVTKDAGGMNALEKEIAGWAVPGLVQWIAKETDDNTKRDPKGMAEQLKANIPGLRSQVPEKHRR